VTVTNDVGGTIVTGGAQSEGIFAQSIGGGGGNGGVAITGTLPSSSNSTTNSNNPPVSDHVVAPRLTTFNDGPPDNPLTFVSHGSPSDPTVTFSSSELGSRFSGPTSSNFSGETNVQLVGCYSSGNPVSQKSIQENFDNSGLNPFGGSSEGTAASLD